MPKKRNVIDFLNDILDAMDKAEELKKDMSFENFQKDAKTIFAVIKAMENIGEASINITDELRKKYNKIPWKKIEPLADRVSWLVSIWCYPLCQGLGADNRLWSKVYGARYKGDLWITIPVSGLIFIFRLEVSGVRCQVSLSLSAKRPTPNDVSQIKAICCSRDKSLS